MGDMGDVGDVGDMGDVGGTGGMGDVGNAPARLHRLLQRSVEASDVGQASPSLDQAYRLPRHGNLLRLRQCVCVCVCVRCI